MSIWLVRELNHEYQSRIQVEIHFGKERFQDDLLIETSGWQLLAYKSGIKKLRVELGTSNQIVLGSLPQHIKLLEIPQASSGSTTRKPGK